MKCSQPFDAGFLQDISGITKDMPADDISGEWIGLARVFERGAEIIRDTLNAMKADGTLAKSDLRDLFTRMIADGHDIIVVYITGQWLNVDDLADVTNADRFL